jgi:long-chain acyl-CoA synthetase
MNPDWLPRQWLQRATTAAERVAFRQKSRGVWRTLTWGEWHARVCELAGKWRACGVNRGSSVVVMIGNRFEWPIIDITAQIMGVAVVGIHPSSSLQEIKAALAATGAKFAVLESDLEVERLGPLHLARDLTTFVLDGPSGADRAAHLALAGLVDEVRGEAVAAKEWHAKCGALRTYSQADLCREIGMRSPHDGLWTVTIVSCARVVERIRQWRSLLAGGTVHFPEAPDTISNDVREVMPDTVFAPGEFWERQRVDVMASLQDAPRLAQSLFRFATRTPNPGWLKRLLVRNVRTHLGIARGQVVFDAPSPGDLMNWYRSIGAAVAPVASRLDK